MPLATVVAEQAEQAEPEIAEPMEFCDTQWRREDLPPLRYGVARCGVMWLHEKVVFARARHLYVFVYALHCSRCVHAPLVWQGAGPIEIRLAGERLNSVKAAQRMSDGQDRGALELYLVGVAMRVSVTSDDMKRSKVHLTFLWFYSIYSQWDESTW